MAAMAMLSLAGCGSEGASISGVVTYESIPIATGTIAFAGESGKVATGNIEDGHYYVTDVEVGPGSIVTISSHVPSPMMQPPTGPTDGFVESKPLEYVKIPLRYSDRNRSGLTYDVVEGEQVFNIDLKP